MEGTMKCSANYIPLSPISFLERSAIVYGDYTSVVYGDLKYTWKETRERCVRLASALAQLGISGGDVVAALAPNIPALYELHFGVPMAGAILCPLNVRYDSVMVSILLRNSDAKVIFVDYQLLHVANGAFELLSKLKAKLPFMVVIQEVSKPTANDNIKNSKVVFGNLEYENLLKTGKPGFEVRKPKDETDPISISYTSGTTGSPKGVVYNHRGAYLNALAEILHNAMSPKSVYLWTVPMFHCNGWCLPWGMAALGGTNVCLRNVSAKTIYENLSRHNVTHMGGAPTILNMIVNASAAERKPLNSKVEVMTGGAPPPPNVLLKMEELSFGVTHSYGMTEVYGPGTFCSWKPEWDSLPPNEKAKIKSRQGLHHVLMEELAVKDPVTMKSVPSDGETMGEVMFRGNTVMCGYLKNLKATKEVFNGGWYRTGDIGVRHSDGYISLKDRSKDIVVCDGKNVSTIEVESVLFYHPAILEAAVVGRPDDHLGETPCAFVKLKEGFNANAEDIIRYCRENLASYMAPRTVVFEDLPKTSTGKTQKYVLRERAEAMGSLTKKMRSKI
ncbi:hypothetical protein Sjap_009745 [Stephania japonica]|uniref:4-coumarate--CoA ligase n=1 Tax=Stephania japonica TaxID=461633 RepID=A0AAP0JAF2_9MAGN